MRVEAELRREKRFADTAIDSLPGIFYFFDKQRKFLRWNRNLEAVTGYSAEEIAVRHPLDLFSGMDKDLVAARIEKVFEDGEATVEAVMASRDGHQTPFYFTGKRTMLDGATYLVGMGIDISERKRLEEQLLHAQKMEGIGRLAGGIAHDFNNLLTAILGYTELIAEEIGEAHPARPYVANVTKAAERAATLTSQLLAFARKQMIAPRIMSLNDLIVDTGAILGRLIGADVELILLSDPDLWHVQADFSQLSQVVINLAVNARDAMPEGGKLIVETANVILDADFVRAHVDVVPGEYVMLSVTDTGVGMDAEVQQHLFEPFFTTKGVGKGTGLGLATCYGIVKQSGGHIWIYSEPGHGTTCKIYFPRVLMTDSAPDICRVEPVISGGSETILLVEDEPLVLNFAANTLRKRDYTVLEACNGQEALQFMQSYTGALDLVVTDVVMPQMSGRVMMEHLHRVRPSVQVIYASGYTDGSIVADCIIEAGMAFLHKPYTPAMLSRKVREVLDLPPVPPLSASERGEIVGLSASAARGEGEAPK
jgi:PAS domain S-box-containing protein